jgi:hypothetical protein
MKVVMMNMGFILPDDFEGNSIDALELYIEYRKSEQAKNNHSEYSDFDDDELYILKETSEIVWDRLMEVNETDGCNSVGSFVFSEYHADGWNPITLEVV